MHGDGGRTGQGVGGMTRQAGAGSGVVRGGVEGELQEWKTIHTA
jgi:hypothetical protein